MLAVMVDWEAVGEKGVSADKVIEEALRRMANKKAGIPK